MVISIIIPEDNNDSSAPLSPTSNFSRPNFIPDEGTPLIGSTRCARQRRQHFDSGCRRPGYSRQQSLNNADLDSGSDSGLATNIDGINAALQIRPTLSRTSSWSARIITPWVQKYPTIEPTSSEALYERVWYDQFSSTDWVHDSIADAYRVKELRSRRDIGGRIQLFFNSSQGWILSALVGFITANIAYVVDVTESSIFDWKDGYCSKGLFIGANRCCPEGGRCGDWVSWSKFFHVSHVNEQAVEFSIYVCLVVLLATISCCLTLTTKTVIPSKYHISTLDENLAAPEHRPAHYDGSSSPPAVDDAAKPMTYYPAAGSGVAEVRVILSGFVLHGFLGVQTLVIKTLALVLSVASGLSLGKEGPYVHIATCVGNISCRLFSKYDKNDAKRREVLSAAAAAGVAVAFGAPIGGVLFCLEEVAYFFPAKTLFRTFFCCITGALTLKFLNPYGTNKIVMFEVRYVTDWEFFELAGFIIVGVLGGATGAIFIKASRAWARSFRKLSIITERPLFEVALVALLTGLVSYWNPFTKLPVVRLLYSLARECDPNKPDDLGLCPEDMDGIIPVIWSLIAAFLIKGILTIITFGIKVPAGIYVPSMVVGGLGGRIMGHLVQWVVLRFPTYRMFGNCAAYVTGQSCITPGIYALVAAGSTMCGVTRLSVTLAIILFELTGSLNYVLPFSLAILVSKWTADAMEPLSIYDVLTDMNDYPFLNNKHKPIFTSDLSVIVPRVRAERIIDISHSPLVSAISLRRKLEILHRAGEIDGGLPIIRNEILVGLIPATDLEFALDNLDNELSDLCLMTKVPNFEDDDKSRTVDPTDFTPYIDPAPLALDINSPMDLVYECFVKLGLRYLCILREGRFAGTIHKKTFAKYIKSIEQRYN